MTNSGNEPIDQAVVLIIDDSFENRLFLSSQLGMEGYDIIQANGGIEGIEIAEEP